MFIPGPSLLSEAEIATYPKEVQDKVKEREAQEMRKISEKLARPINRIWTADGRASLRMEAMLREKQREDFPKQFAKFWESTAAHTLALTDHTYHHWHEMEEMLHLEGNMLSAAAKNAMIMAFAGTTDQFGAKKHGHELALANNRALMFGQEGVFKNFYADKEKDNKEHLWRWTLANHEQFATSLQDEEYVKMAQKEFTNIISGAVSKPDIIASAFEIGKGKKGFDQYQAILDGTFKPSKDQMGVSDLKEVQKKIARLLALHGFVKKINSDPATAISAAGVLLELFPDNEPLKAIHALKGMTSQELAAALKTEEGKKMLVQYRLSDDAKRLGDIEDEPFYVLKGQKK